MDITELILTQHAEQRQAFAYLDEMRGEAPDALAAVWHRLEVLLESHAAAEEQFFYPALLAQGKDPAEEVQDAVKDHNEIREGVRAARTQQPGSSGWWQAVARTRKANDAHMAEEERDDLPDFKAAVDLDTRHRLAVTFLAYEGEHGAQGVPPVDEDPQAYVRRGGPSPDHP